MANIFENFSLMNFYIYFSVSLIISFIWLSVCLYFDRKKPEPTKEIIKAFLWGMFAVFIALFSGGPVSDLVKKLNLCWVAKIFVLSFFIDGLFEEGAKFLILFKRFYPRKAFDEPKDGMIYGMTLGLGFAFFENIFYSIFPFQNLMDTLQELLLRGISATLVHFLAGGIVGYFLAIAKFSNFSSSKKLKLIVLGLILAIVFHGLYNIFLRLNYFWILIPIAVLLVSVYFFILKGIERLNYLKINN